VFLHLGFAWLPLALALLVSCVASPRSDPSERSLPLAAVDASGFDALLREHVVDGHVEYAAFAAAPELSLYLSEVREARLAEGTPEPERLAFLLNAYNALAIRGILDGGSPATLLGRYGFFMRTRHSVAGEAITLWDLEHERIRPLGEPRIHFALVCASASCPKLASEAFDPARLEEQLERETLRFVNDAQRNRFDAERRVASLSAIFDWYAEDFEASDGSVERFVARYVDDPEVAQGLAAGEWVVESLGYDWSLNGTPAPPQE